MKETLVMLVFFVNYKYVHRMGWSECV